MLTTKPNSREAGNGIPVPDKQQFGILGLPRELQACVFQQLPELRSVMSLRLTCRHLNSVYLGHENRIRSSLVNYLVAPFYDHYKFLTRLWVPESSILYPPLSGWPNVTVENCEHLGIPKTSFAVEVLRRLPYVKNTGSCSDMIHFQCRAVNYSDFNYRAQNQWFHETNKTVPRHVVDIGSGFPNGVQILLDTVSGTICENRIQGGIRTEPGAACPAEHYFAARKRACEDLDFVFLPAGDHLEGPQEEPYDAAEMEAKGEPIPRNRRSDGGRRPHKEVMQWVRHLYRKYGWPGADWRKEEAKEAIMAFLFADFDSEEDIHPFFTEWYWYDK